MGFVRQQALLGAFGPFPFLTSDLFYAGTFGIRSASSLSFDFIKQHPTGDEPVESLLARGLTFDLHAGRAMEEHHTGGSLVDVLSAVPTGANKRFLNVHFIHTQHCHALDELKFLILTDRKRAHGFKVTGSRTNGNVTVRIRLTVGVVICRFFRSLGSRVAQW